MDGKKRQKQNPLTDGANYNGQAANESVKTTRPGRLSMAGFEVYIYGRFSGVHRGSPQIHQNTKPRTVSKAAQLMP
jgi:hypothetical protein